MSANAIYEYVGRSLKRVMEDQSQAEALVPYVITVLKRVGGDKETRVENGQEELKDVVKDDGIGGFLSEVFDHIDFSPEWYEGSQQAAPVAKEEDQYEKIVDITEGDDADNADNADNADTAGERESEGREEADPGARAAGYRIGGVGGESPPSVDNEEEKGATTPMDINDEETLEIRRTKRER
eukprot:gene8956-13866_t